jgi:hypothetical protein
MDIFGKYLLARNAETQQGQNMFAMAQTADAINKDRELRNVLSQAYTPSIPAESRMGPTQPGQPLQPTRGRMDLRTALNSMYEGGFGPEALKMETQMKAKGGLPATVQEWQYYNSLKPGEKEEYLTMKRARKFLDIGEGFVAPSMTDPTVTKPVAERTLKPTEEPEYIAEKAETAVKSKALAEEENLLADMEAGLPALKEVTTKLSRLGKIATFTKAGQAFDEIARQTGQSTKGAVARAEYIAMVANEILPLLRQTFGAAFTAAEGESLKATLGDPNSSPAEKDAQLKAFIESKERQIRSKQRRVGDVPRETRQTAPQAAIDYLKNNNSPAMRKQFQAKYGYLP